MNRKRTGCEFNCKVCGVSFYRYPSEIKRGRTKFCKSCIRPSNDKEYKEKLLNNITKNGDCWEWNNGKQWFGHGATYYKGRHIKTHRLSYLLFNGEIPKGKMVCHKCDNPPCINPEHLFIGSAKDNVMDAIKKKRHKVFGRNL